MGRALEKVQIFNIVDGVANQAKDSVLQKLLCRITRTTATITQRPRQQLSYNRRLTTQHRAPLPGPAYKSEDTKNSTMQNMALLSNQITPNPQKSSKDKLTSTQIKQHNMHTVNDKIV